MQKRDVLELHAVAHAGNNRLFAPLGQQPAQSLTAHPQPGGRLLTHDIMLRRQDGANGVLAQMRQAINVNVQPMTLSEWRALGKDNRRYFWRMFLTFRRHRHRLHSLALCSIK